MSFDNEKYIIDLTKQLNLRNMDDAQRARLADLVKKGVATKEQKEWWKLGLSGTDTMAWDAPQIDATTPGDPTTTPPTPETYTYTGVDTATGTAPSANDLVDLYKKMLVIMRDVQADKDLRENDPTKKFLNTFYGAGKAVEPYTITPLADAPGIGLYINSNLKDFARFFQGEIKEKDLSDLATKLNAGSYVSDTKSLKTLKSFLSKISYYYSYGGDKPLPARDIPACLGSSTGTPPVAALNINSIDNIIERVDTPVLPASLDTFKDQAPNIFGQLVASEKLREKVTGKDENGDITKWLNKGLSKSDYNSGDNKLAPMYEDRKRWFQRAKNKVIEKYGDTLGKLKNKHSRHKYSTQARLIVEQLIKKNIDPTSGMEKLYSTLGAIKGELPNPVQKQLGWITDTLGKFSDKTFFKEALRDGAQMRQLIQEIIKAAVHENPPKTAEAEIALEMLAVMRYTMTTSSVRDNLKKTDFTIFSDSNLSANKNEFVQAFTKATDKLIKATVMGAFEIGNLAKNAIKTSGVKFGHGTGRLDKRTTSSVEYADPDKRKTMEYLFARWDFFNSSKATKDYNIFTSHKAKQAEADSAGTPGTTTITTSAGTSYSIDDPTKQQERWLEYLRQHNIGRA